MSETSAGPLDIHVPPGTPATTRVLLVEDDEGDAFLVRELLLDAAPDIEIERVRTLAEAAVL
ncbi:MAG: hypothetical protein QOH75_950, partial [Actinomycetota bacterium]|nr:hypothetical protein [Actinomycetota bacterium]